MDHVVRLERTGTEHANRDTASSGSAVRHIGPARPRKICGRVCSCWAEILDGRLFRIHYTDHIDHKCAHTQAFPVELNVHAEAYRRIEVNYSGLRKPLPDCAAPAL